MRGELQGGRTAFRWAAPTASPKPLALLRIIVPAVILASPELYAARALAAAPERLAFIPEGLVLLARIPIGPAGARVLQVLALSSAATALLGWWSRTSMLVLTVSAGLLFSLSQREGAVLHDMHLFWMTALLAASPCGDVWALDAWGKPRPAPSRRYGVPLFFSRLFLGLVYFFPALHKLRVSGLGWMTAANVTHQMHAKWLEMGNVPPLRPDRWPVLCAAGAVLVVLFELTFGALALASPRTRWVALGAGLAFHLSTEVFFFIPFVSLWACYVVLLDANASANAGESAGANASATVSGLVGGVIALSVFVQGARGKTEAWPFACYPTFANVQDATIPDVVVEVVSADGATQRFTGRERTARSQSEWGRVFRISGAYGDPPAVGMLREHARLVLRGAAVAKETVARTRIYRVAVATAPGSWADAPAGGTLLTELPGLP